MSHSTSGVSNQRPLARPFLPALYHVGLLRGVNLKKISSLEACSASPTPGLVGSSLLQTGCLLPSDVGVVFDRL
jgi:hypothetical protein